MKYALVGLGAMGMGMIKSMKTAGLDVYGVDISADRLLEFNDFGGKTERELRNVATDCDVIILVLVNSQQIESVISESLDLIKKGALIISCSTVSPKFIVELGNLLHSKNIELLDAPISGGKLKADIGEITVMGSGSKENFAKANDFLNAVGKNIYNLGEKIGLGSTMKVVHQLLAGVHIVAAAEAVAMGKKAGLDLNTLYEIVLNAAGYSWMFENRVKHILDDDFSPKSAVDIFVKDLNLVVESATQLDIELPVANSALAQFTKAKEMGLGLEDDSAVVKVYK